MSGHVIGAPSLRPAAGVLSSPARPDEPALAQIIGRVYDAAIGQDDWPSVLTRLSAMLGGTTAVLHHFHTQRREAISTAVNTDPAYIELYDRHYHKTEPKLAILSSLPGDGVFVDREFLPEAELVRTEHYNDFLLPQDVHGGVNWIEFGPTGIPVAGLTLWRSRHRDGWSDGDVRMMRHLSGHFRRALRVERHLAGTVPPGPRVELTPRERECLSWVARGASSKEAARRLALSVYTVNEYIASAMRKLGAMTRTEAVAVSLAQGLIEG